ncbi:MAG TPA: T9SS type A sorting domain-containing protein, partial [Rubricoccaceae bacterium]
ATVAGGAGWRLLSAPAAGVTVNELAAINLVQGVPGYYPTAGPNLYTGYDGSAYVASGGAGTTLALGRGFWWHFYDIEGTPGGPSTSHALPTVLATTRPATTTNVPVTLHAAGDKFNLLGNPFGTSLNVNGISTWPGASSLASYVAQIWDANARTYDVSPAYPTIAPWQGFFVEGSVAGTLTIPATARTTGGVLEREDPAPLVAFTLAQADGPLQDRAAVLTFPSEATDGADAFDAAKLSPMADAYVMAALEGGPDVLRAVESRPAPGAAEVRVPLHVTSVGAGDRLVLSWPLIEAVPAEWALTLTDVVTGQTVDLRAATEYAFTVDPETARTDARPAAARALATGSARFVVTVGPRGATASEADPGVELALETPRPNPTSDAAVVGYTLAESGAVRLSVVDLLGREVAVLEDSERPAGRHTARLEAQRFAPGVYVVRLATAGRILVRRVVVVR